MGLISVLFVDDEESIRTTFDRRFGKNFNVFYAADGQEAGDILSQHDDIQVVVTDIRMPRVDGFELIRRSRSKNPELGFIVVSGHGDTEDVIRAMRLGARNFFRKPYSFSELEKAIRAEAERYILLQRERQQRIREQETENYLVEVQNLTYLIPNDMDLVSTIAFRLVRVFEAMGICDGETRQNTALGLMELIANAIEHGNLEVSGDTKAELKAKGDSTFSDEIARRAKAPPYQDRFVKIMASVRDTTATVHIEDEGPGFDLAGLPDPTDPENLFKPSGRGILMAQMFLDELRYSQRGNVVTAIMHKRQPGN